MAPVRRFAGSVIVALLVALACAMPTRPPAAADTASTPPTTTVAAARDAPATVVEDNPFIPEDQNLSECISALPKPGCGSEARGGWRQTLVFVIMAVALAFVGWRIVRSMRRRGVPT